MLLGFIVILICAIVTPCVPIQTGVVKGRIASANRDSEGARLFFYPQNAEPCSTVADSMGTYRQVLPAGKVSIFAYTKEGYAIAKKVIELPPEDVVTYNMLWYPGWIKGKILGLNAEALKSVKVCAYPEGIQGYCRRADEKGEYKLAIQKGKTPIKIFLNTSETVYESIVSIMPGMILIKDFNSQKALKEPQWRMNIKPSGEVVLEVPKEQFDADWLRELRFEWHLKHKGQKALEYFIKSRTVSLNHIIQGDYEAVLYTMHKDGGRQSVAFEFTTPSSSPSYREEGVLEALSLIQYLLTTPVDERVNGQIPWFSTTHSDEMDKLIADIAARLKYPIGLSKKEDH